MGFEARLCKPYEVLSRPTSFWIRTSHLYSLRKINPIPKKQPQVYIDVNMSEVEEVSATNWFSVYDKWGKAILQDDDHRATAIHNQVRKLTQGLVQTRAKTSKALLDKLEVWLQDNIDNENHLNERPLSDLIILSVIRDLLALQNSPELRPHTLDMMEAMSCRVITVPEVECLCESAFKTEEGAVIGKRESQIA